MIRRFLTYSFLVEAAGIASAAEKKNTAASGSMDSIGNFFRKLLTEDFDFAHADYALVLGIFTAVVFVVLSGAWAAEIAVRKHRCQWLFFIAGCLVPVVAPVVLWLAVKKKEESEAEIGVKTGSEKAGEGAGAIAEKGPWNGEMPPEGWTKGFFRRIALNEDGTPAGPWLIAYNGKEFLMVEIMETQDDFMKAKIKNRTGECITARIPYEKIENVKLPTAQSNEDMAPNP